MSEVITTDQLIQEVRDQSDEHNERSPEDDHIVRLLNRGQRIVGQVLARSYPDPLVKRDTLSIDSSGYNDIPSDCFEDRILSIEITIPGSTPVETRRRSYRDATRLATAASVAIPSEWDIEGRRIRWLQTPTGVYEGRVWYVRKLLPLVKQQGKITTVGATYVIVDTAGDDLSSSSDEVESYVNIVNRQTGEVRASFQISSISNGTITFRASALRSTVAGQTISGSASLATSGASVDDYVCIVTGTCVPYFADGISHYLVEYAVSELARSHADPQAQLSQTVLRDMEGRVETTGSGRELTERVKHRSTQWTASNGRRRWPTQRSQ